MVLPWLFILFQMVMPVTSGGLGSYSDKTEFSTNAHFLLSMGLIIWVFSSVIHIIFAHRFKCHADAIADDLVEKVGAPCPVERTFMMTDEEYAAACDAVATVAEEKAKEKAAARAAYEASLEEELGEDIEFREDGWI